MTPDTSGNYATGTWTQVATMPSGYAPLYFGSAVLPDGRYIAEGGEYNNGQDAWTTKGAIYDPVANTWTSVAPPSGWNSIGDSPSVDSEQRNLHTEQLLRHGKAGGYSEPLDPDLDRDRYRASSTSMTKKA